MSCEGLKVGQIYKRMRQAEAHMLKRTLNISIPEGPQQAYQPRI